MAAASSALGQGRRVRDAAKRLVGWERADSRGWRRALREHFLRDLDVGLRYAPAIPAASRAGRVLEVGSGPYGIAPFARRSVVGVDLSFAGPRHRLLLPVRARGDGLPFGNGAFDVVLCFDVLEHVPPDRRPAVVGELVRVCRGRLMMAVPFGAAAADADARAAQLWRSRDTVPHPWLEEHLVHGIPTAADVDRLVMLVGRAPIRREPYTWLALWWLARKEEISARPDLVLLRRVLLPPLLPWLARLGRHHAYRLLLEFDLGREALA